LTTAVLPCVVLSAPEMATFIRPLPSNVIVAWSAATRLIRPPLAISKPLFDTPAPTSAAELPLNVAPPANATVLRMAAASRL
jgi:hypothetical protein